MIGNVLAAANQIGGVLATGRRPSAAAASWWLAGGVDPAQVAGVWQPIGAAGTAAQGSITVTNETTGALTIALAAVASDDLPIVSGFYDIQMLTASGVTTLTNGTFMVTIDTTRSIA